MKKLSIYILILLSASEIMHAQSNFKPGYILTNSNDTIYGLIDFKTDATNAMQCKYKAGEDKAETVYYPGDIAGYRFFGEGKYYVTHAVTINNEPYTLFLEYLVKGMMNLYYCKIDEQDYYFFERDGEMTEITKKPDSVVDMGTMRIVTDTKYKNFISYYFRDYPFLINNAEKIDFNQKSFIDIAKRYHDATCTTGESCIVFQNEHPDKDYTIFKLSVYGGLEFSSYSMADLWGNDLYYQISSLSPVIGGKVNIYNPRWTKSYSIQAAISLSPFNEKGQAVFDNNKVYYELKTIILTGKIGLEYKFPLKKIRPMFGGGVLYTSHFADNNRLYYDANLDARDFSFGTPELSFFVNLGVEYALGNHAVFIQTSFEKYINTSLSKGEDKFKTFHIVAGYTF